MGKLIAYEFQACPKIGIQVRVSNDRRGGLRRYVYGLLSVQRAG